MVNTGSISPSGVYVPPVTRPSTPPTPESGPNPITAPDATLPTQEVALQSPASAAFNPDAAALPAVESQPEIAQDLSALLNPTTQLTPEQRNRLDQLAKNLGFRDLGMMQHHLRHLDQRIPSRAGGPADMLASDLLKQLVRQAAQSPNPTQAIREAFTQVYRQALNQSFNSQGLPAPNLQTETLSGTPPKWITRPDTENSWDPASIASIYSGVESIRKTDPERLRSLGTSPGMNSNGTPNPMTFIRRSNPPITNPDQYLSAMTEATRIAHTNPDNGTIYIYDTAVRGDHSAITNQIVDKLTLINRFDNRGTELDPRYQVAELEKRGLNRKAGESIGDYRRRLVATLTSPSTDTPSWTQRFGGGTSTEQATRLQEAVNFIIRYRGLSNPVHGGFEEIPENGNLNDPALQRTLARFGAGNLQEVMARMEQTDAVRQLQGFLQSNAPSGARGDLDVDGYSGPKTRSMVQSFQAGMAINNLKERIEDDPKLSEERKRELVGFLNQKYQELTQSPGRTNRILQQVNTRMQNLVAEQPSQLEPHTTEQLRADMNRSNRLQSGRFDENTARGLVQNWFNVLDSGRNQDLAEQLAVHEMGHIWENTLNRQNPNWQVTENWQRLFNNPAASKEFSTSSMNTNDGQDQLHNDRTSASDYGSTNAQEDFAEASRVFTYDPERLMRRSLMKFLFLNSLNGNRYNATQVMEMAQKCGYSPADVQERLNSFLGESQNDIRFTAGMSAKLRQDYAPLRQMVDRAALPPNTVHFSSTSPAGASDAATAHQGPLSAATSMSDVSAASGTAQVGNALDNVISHIRPLYQRSIDSTLPASERENARAALRELNDQLFTENGLTNLGVPTEAQRAFQELCQTKGYTEKEGRAMLAVVAIQRLSGNFNAASFPEIDQALPAGFKQLMRQPHFSSLVGQGSDSASTSTSYVLSSLLDQAQFTHKQGDLWSERFSGFYVSSEPALSSLGEHIHFDSSLANNPFALSIQADRVLNNPAFASIFAELHSDVDYARSSFESSIPALNGVSGQSLSPPSTEELKKILVMAVLSGKTSEADLRSFMQDALVGGYSSLATIASNV